MLTELCIQDFLLIKKATVGFQKGFTAITGETGTGKSMLMQAINFICGSKLGRDIIRPGAEKALVVCTFESNAEHTFNQLLMAALNDLDIHATHAITIRRSLDVTGKSKSFINDTPVTQQTLKHIASFLFHIHGQFDNLFDDHTQLDYLDQFAALENARAEVRAAYMTWKEKKSIHAALVAEKERLATQKDYLIHVVQELDDAHPLPDEESNLLDRRQIIMQGARLQTTFQKAEQTLSGDGGIYDRISDLNGYIQTLSESLPALSDARDSVNKAMDILGHVEAAILRENQRADQDDDIETLDERLSEIRDLARKHRVTGDQLHTIHHKLRRDLETLTHGETTEAECRADVIQTRTVFLNHAKAIHTKRITAAAELRLRILEELPPLKLEKVDFKIDLVECDDDQATARGITQATFNVRTNPGLPFGKLNAIASGGELSRFMLALRVAMHHAEGSQILIFDEIDAGTGGSVASAIGKRLQRLSADQQVLAITHAPQVVAFAHNHLRLHKSHSVDETQTLIIPLADHAQRIAEMARMLSGDKVTPTTEQAAQELLENAV